MDNTTITRDLKLSESAFIKSDDEILSKQIWSWLVPIALAITLLVISNVNIVLFHTLAELFAIAVAITLSVVAWHMYPFTKNNYLMFLGCGYFWVAMLDLIHALSYKGMGVFDFAGSNETVQFWLVARYLEATVLLLAPFYLTNQASRKNIFAAGGLIFAALVTIVFTGALPISFIEGEGLTFFKVGSEYIIMAILFASMIILWHKKHLIEEKILKLVLLSTALTICAELAFTFYISLFGLSNIIGHIFKLFSFWLIFVAVIRTTLESPFLAMARGANTYDAIPNATILVDKDGIIRQANRAATKLADQPREALIGKHCHDIFHPNSSDPLLCPICKKISAGEEMMSLEHGSGNTGKYYDYSLAAINDSYGTQGMVQTIRDISAKKLAETKLVQSERYNRMLFEHSPMGLALSRMDGSLVDINSAFAEITGHTIKETLKFSYWDITPEKYQSQEQDQLEGLAKAGEYGPYEKEYIHKDGHLVPVRLHGMLLEKDGESYIWSSVEDITERKLAEKKLHQAAVVVESTAEAIIVTDAKFKIISVNKAFTDITGYSEEEAIGKTPRILKSNQHSRDFYKTLWTEIHGYGRWQGEIWDRKKNGSLFPSWSTISAIKDSNNNIINYISVFSDISTLKQSQEKLDFLAYHDPLTGLPNRLLLNDRIEHAVKGAQRKGLKVGLLFIDLDRFKNINDSLGHSIGDKLLKQVAVRLKSSIRDIDTVARLGGDEFVIVIEDINHTDDAILLANKLLTSFIKPFDISKHTLFITPSIGVSVYPEDGSDSETLIRNADTAMYHAKETGRNSCHLYSADLTDQAVERLTLESALRNAMDYQQFELFYQPQHSLQNNSLLGAEALLRWNHPEMGYILPNTFIPLAEDIGLIDKIGTWALKEACKQMQAWLYQGYKIGTIAVNISGMQFRQDNIINTVLDALTESGLPARHLELEITESTILKRPEQAIDSLNKLKEMGVRVSIDDFGTGYSSLSQLKQLPVNKLKIDQSFIRDISSDPDNEAIACAVIALGKSLKLNVIAEGVETEEEKQLLIAHGCDEAQGYLFGHPMPSETLTTQVLARAV